MTAPGIDLDALLRRLHLPTVRRLYPDLAQRAEQEGLAYREFLALLIAEEVAHRAQTRIQRCVRRAQTRIQRCVRRAQTRIPWSPRVSWLRGQCARTARGIPCR